MKNSGLESGGVVNGKQDLNRKPYAMPVLTCFGSVRSLTASGSGTMAEQYNMSTMQCDASATKSPCPIP